MRIVDRQTFLSLPCPVVYMKMPDRWIHEGSICIKVANMGENDWAYQSFDSPDDGYIDSGDWSVMLDKMIDQGDSYPIESDNTQRDALYEDGDLFLIYEKNDLRYVINELQEVHDRL